MIRFVVQGQAKGAGSKRAFRLPNGRINVVEGIKGSKEWQRLVAQVAADHHAGELLAGPLSVEFSFFTPRPRSHYGSGRNSDRVRASAPLWPVTRPDVLKLARAAEDALTGVIWRDDAQIVSELLLKQYGKARLEVSVDEMVNVHQLEAMGQA